MTVLELLDLRPTICASRFAVGSRFRARGLPAVLLGIAAIVLAAGLGDAARCLVTVVPESLREARALWLALQGERREMLRP